ncbi:MAG: hypothetical protein K0Q90_1164 [Paenibacillaceae bacterium]|nr:hypothetical protein [Paenibacillaceae bacterium]
MRSTFIHEANMSSSMSLIVKSLGLLLLVLACSGVFWSARAAAEQDVLAITEARLLSGPEELTGFIRIAEDQGRFWTLEQAADPARDRDYLPYSSSGLAGSQSESAFWVKLELVNAVPSRRDLILELEKPHLSYVTFYWTDGATGSLQKEVEAGRALPFRDRLVPHRNFIYPVSFPPESRQVIYMRIVTDSYLQLPMKLWTAEGFLGKEQSTNLALGIFYGVMLGIALFNLFLFLLIRERVYLYYVLFVMTFVLLQAVWDGVAYQYLWPGWPGWEAKSNPVLLVSVVLSALLFTHHFISVAEHAPRLGKLNRLASGGGALLLLVLVLLPGALSTKIAVYGVAAGMVMIIANMIGVRFRNRASRYYAAAWLLLLAGALVNLLAAFKLMPLNAITLYAPRIGMGGEAMLLSMALADRYNTLKKAKQSEERQGLLLRELHEMSKTLTATYDLDRLLDYTVESFIRVTGCEAGCIVLESEEGAAVKAARGNIGRWTGVHTAGFDTDNNEDVSEGPRVRLEIPIRHQGRQLGEVLLFSSRPVQVPDNELAILAEYAGQVGISIENARLFQEISRMATTDGLTGAFNRSYVLQLAASDFRRCQEAREPMSLMMLDIDWFKEINDRYGHLAGDKVIRKVARTLKKLVHTNGVTGRYGGEEFIVLLPGMKLEVARQLAEKLREGIGMLDIPMDGAGLVRVTVSLGLAAAAPSMKSVEELVDLADAALYRAKAAGRNRVEEEVPASRQTGSNF